ncbi:MAG: hypothetical protein AAF696_34870, partial [Bacteroidota bacterium]
MSRDLKTYSLLLDYLSGEIGEEDKLALEALWKDPEKRSELLAQASIEEGGDAYYRQHFEALHAEMKPKAARRKILLWSSIAAAAVIALFLIFGGLLNGLFVSPQERLFADNYDLPSLSSRTITKGPTYDLTKPDLLIDELAAVEKLEALQALALGVA